MCVPSNGFLIKSNTFYLMYINSFIEKVICASLNLCECLTIPFNSNENEVKVC